MYKCKYIWNFWLIATAIVATIQFARNKNYCFFYTDVSHSCRRDYTEIPPTEKLQQLFSRGMLLLLLCRWVGTNHELMCALHLGQLTLGVPLKETIALELRV